MGKLLGGEKKCEEKKLAQYSTSKTKQQLDTISTASERDMKAV